METHIYIHTYIFGHYNPSVRIIDLVSHTTYVVCVNFLYISGGTYSLKSTPNETFFEKLFMAILFTLRVFVRNHLRGYRRRILFVFRFDVWPGTSGQTTSALRLIMRASKTGHSFGCVARSAVLLKPNVANIHLFNFCEEKFIQHGPITIASSCLISKKKWPNYATGPKSAPNSDAFWVRRLFNVCMQVFCAPNATIFLVYIRAKIRMSFI